MGVQERAALLPEKGLFPISKGSWFPLNRNLCDIDIDRPHSTQHCTLSITLLEGSFVIVFFYLHSCFSLDSACTSASVRPCEIILWKYVLRKSGGEKYFVPKLEIRRPGIVNCGISTFLAWIFHSEEHSQKEQEPCVLFVACLVCFSTDTCLFTPRGCSSFPFSLWEAEKLCQQALHYQPSWRGTSFALGFF